VWDSLSVRLLESRAVLVDRGAAVDAFALVKDVAAAEAATAV